MSLYKHKRQEFNPEQIVAPKPKPVPKPKPKPIPKPEPKPEPVGHIPKEVLDALARIETKVDNLIKKDEEVHKKIDKELLQKCETCGREFNPAEGPCTFCEKDFQRCEKCDTVFNPAEGPCPKCKK